jgi:hypothetical protein
LTAHRYKIKRVLGTWTPKKKKKKVTDRLSDWLRMAGQESVMPGEPAHGHWLWEVVRGLDHHDNIHSYTPWLSGNQWWPLSDHLIEKTHKMCDMRVFGTFFSLLLPFCFGFSFVNDNPNQSIEWYREWPWVNRHPHFSAGAVLYPESAGFGLFQLLVRLWPRDQTRPQMDGWCGNWN